MLSKSDASEPSPAPIVPPVETNSSSARGRVVLRRCARRTLALTLIVLGVGLWIWGHLALRYSNIPSPWLRELWAWGYSSAGLALFLVMPSLWRAALCFFGASALLVLWWLFIPASHERDWVRDLRRQPTAEIEGDLVTVRNIRDFSWQNGWDRFDARYYDATFDLRTIEGVDLIICYWDEVRAIAHTILSFRFTGSDPLAVSIEVRREVGESYSPFQGLFKQFELHYVVASESDAVQVRSNHRGEEVYLYPTRATPGQARALFLSYVERLNRLATRPEYYHTIFNNCTTNIVGHINQIMPQPVPGGGKVLFNGYSDVLAYELGWIDDSVPYRDLRDRHYISERARAAADSEDFSTRIRITPR